MPQQTGADQSAAPDDTARLAGGPVLAPPPVTGRAPAPEVPAADGSAREVDDTRPVSHDWMTAPPEADPTPAPEADASPSPSPTPEADATPAPEADASPSPTPEADEGLDPADGTGSAPSAADEDATAQAWTPQELTGYEPALEEPTPGETVLLPADDGPAGPGEPPAGGGDGPAGDAPAPRRPWWRHPAVLTPAAAVAVLAGAYGADLLVASGDVPRHTVVAGVHIGGLSPADAARTLERDLAPQISADHTVVAADFSTTLSPATAGISLDVDATVAAAEDQPLNPWTRLMSFFSDRDVAPVLVTDQVALDAQLEGIAGQVDQPPVEGTIAVDGTTAQLVQPADGRTLDREGAADAITAALASGTDPGTPIELPVEVASPHVDAAEAQRVLDQTVTPALAAPITLVSEDGGTSVEIPETAIAAALTFTPQDDGQLVVGLDPEKLQSGLGDQLAAFGTPAKDATFEIHGDSISIVPSVDGTGVDPAALADKLLPALGLPAPRTVTAQLGPVPAAFTTEQARALGITEKVSSFTTHFTSSASGTNIRVVAAEVDGAIVRPGETFSLNTYTGPRGTAQGYVPAAVISGGKLSQAVGGGISQFATTMFNAVFFAGLEDVHHKPHSFYISRYPAGREATVYEGQIDLVWKNDTDTGIYVQTEWVPGSITVTFWGTRHYDIESVSGERRNIRQPSVQEKEDNGDCTPQSGSTGFDITVTRVFKDLNSGAEIRRENFNTHYAAEAIIHCVPPEKEPPAGPEGTTPAPGPGAGGRRPGGRRSA